ncbi:MAG TPA: vWA domain-containing protein [Gaiellaceae bacterium]
MSSIPYAGTGSFEPLARRTWIVRAALGLALVVLVVLAALSVLRPHATEQPILAPQSGGVVVLDLSASITQDTYSRIHETLQSLVARGGRYGLVVFSNVAYEALPPGTPASALTPIARYFAVPTSVPRGEQPTFTVNPWSATFTSGTEISQGLDLARTIELRSHTKHPAVVLISDLADDPNDLQRLNTVLNEYQVGGFRLRVIALNPAPSDVARFKGLIGRASSIIPAGLSTPGTAPATPHTSFPTLFVVLAVLVAALLSVSELWGARLSWGSPA